MPCLEQHFAAIMGQEVWNPKPKNTEMVLLPAPQKCMCKALLVQICVSNALMGHKSGNLNVIAVPAPDAGAALCSL